MLLRIPVKEAEVVKRINRFVLAARIGRTPVKAWLNNTGRLKELIFPGNKVFLTEIQRPKKLHYRVVAFKEVYGPALVDTKLQEKIFETAISEGIFEEFGEFQIIKRAPKALKSTFDFLLQNSRGQKLIVELKSAVLRKAESYASYPDVFSARGERHLKTLTELVRRGTKAAVVFFCGLNNIKGFLPNTAVMKNLAELLKDFVDAGGEVFAVKPTSMTTAGSYLTIKGIEEIPVYFQRPARDHNT